MDHSEKLTAIKQELEQTALLPTLRLKADAKTPLTSYTSKIGGIPYMPKGFDYPLDAKGNPLCFLAQINFQSKPPLEGFPAQGMLQFYIGTDWNYGMPAAHDLRKIPIPQKNFRVIYHEQLLEPDALTIEMPALKWEKDSYGGEYEPPFTKPLALIGEVATQPIDYTNVGFEEALLVSYNKHFNEESSRIPRHVSNHIYDACYYERVAFMDDQGGEHRMGGYPMFSQNDPREYDPKLRHYDTLLLQIDSEFNPEEREFEIIWGDMGTAQFFINQESLERLDFSDVLFDWACG
ncbi:MAG: YwqG family protein [Turicibacter sp.]|nr:YwqG family protein [Turicibacter sp.]